MNIFFLHTTPILAARAHCDKHVVKMVLETAQILAAVHHIHGNGANVTYKPTHLNHPCVKWAAASPANYRWLQRLGYELANEYRFRYGKDHKCEALINGELNNPPTALAGLPTLFTEPPKCMPDEYKRESTVDSYRAYYAGAKASIAKWAFRGVPSFMADFADA
jgi:hypothetical protein